MSKKKTTEYRPRVAIGLPTTGTIKTKTAFSIFRLIKHSHQFDFDIITKESSILHWNREHIVKKAIEGKCDYVLFIDSDMFFEPDALEKLYKRNKDIVGATYNLRSLDKISTLKNVDVNGNPIWEEFKEEKLVKCAAIGTGFVLIKTSVFEKLKEPWFFWKSNENGEVVMGEDSWFCEEARKAGFEIWADLSVPMKHIGDFLY